MRKRSQETKTENKGREETIKIPGSSHLSLVRLFSFITGALVSTGIIIFFGYRERMSFDILSIHAVFLLMLYGLSVYLIMDERKKGSEIYRSTSYRRWLFIFLFLELFFILSVGFNFFRPEFMLPAAFLLNASSGFKGETGLISFFIFFLIIFGYANNEETLSILVWSVIASFAADILKKRIRSGQKKRYACITIFSAVLFSSVGLNYLSRKKISAESCLISLCFSLLVILLLQFFPFVLKFFRNERADVYKEILSPDYSLCKTMKQFSPMDFSHAVKVSGFAKKAAEITGADERAAAAGGLYYRFPKIFSRDVSDEAIKILEDHSFPREVIDIVYEYKGELRKPSSQESAIVLIVDSVIQRFELMTNGSMDNSWNQSIMTYQAVNDMSREGLFDESGLSQNQLLTIRNMLAEADLIKNFTEGT